MYLTYTPHPLSLYDNTIFAQPSIDMVWHTWTYVDKKAIYSKLLDLKVLFQMNW